MNPWYFFSILVVLVGLASSDMLRKSIVFDKATPDVFYCPVDKPVTFEKMYVRARPIEKLCEHGGKRMPDDYASDCYNDVDESDFACKEKRRITKRLEEEQKEALEMASVNKLSSAASNAI